MASYGVNILNIIAIHLNYVLDYDMLQLREDLQTLPYKSLEIILLGSRYIRGFDGGRMNRRDVRNDLRHSPIRHVYLIR